MIFAHDPNQHSHHRRFTRPRLQRFLTRPLDADQQLGPGWNASRSLQVAIAHRFQVELAFGGADQCGELAGCAGSEHWIAVVTEVNGQLAILADNFELHFTGFGDDAAVLRLAVFGVGQRGVAVGAED